ncbi:MAG: J domain-containing protein [Alphaproteobacteria bacterium]|jgi:curved DNA-binding protein CbpA
MARRKKTESTESSGERCAWAGCAAPGDFRAPRSRQQIHEYQWFCADHIKEFNKNWNYFEGMNEAQIYAFQKDATTGHRPTWRVDTQRASAEFQLENAFLRMFGDGRYREISHQRPIPPKDRDALATLDLEHPVTQRTIKTQYRELVKKYHPDVNQGNPHAEDAFKKITIAYQHLMVHYREK